MEKNEIKSYFRVGSGAQLGDEEMEVQCNRKTFNIGFTRIDEAGEHGDETQFDVDAGNETELLELFGVFIKENNYMVSDIHYVEEVPYDGDPEDVE